MTKISTKDVERSMQKMIQPGNNICKILSADLEGVPYKKEAYNLNLNCVGPDIKDFEGFFIDKKDESKGRHKGQVGRIRASEFAFYDGETKSGVKVKRDIEIARFIKNLCRSLKYNSDIEAETIEDFVKEFNRIAPFNDKWLRMCIAGREYQNKQGYTNYDLFLPRPGKGVYSYELASVPEEESRIYKFNPEIHIKKGKKSTPVESFEKPVSSITKDQFRL